MSEIQKDQELVNKGRKKKLKGVTNEKESIENKEVEVVVPLRDQINTKLFNKLKELNIARKVTDLWSRGNNERAEWLTRQEEYVTQIDEFINPIYKSATDWGSTLHLPTILTVCKTFHARMYSALTSVDPMFNVRARKEAHVDHEKTVENVIRYAIKEWANNYQGVNPSLDAWIWNWVTTGVGILKWRWDRRFTKFIDVEEVPYPKLKLILNEQTGQTETITDIEFKEQEVNKTIVTFEGPCLENLKVEDLVIIGGEGDPQEADYVIQQCWLTASELYTLADQKIFDEEAVNKVVKAGRDKKHTDQTGDIKQIRSEQSGEVTPDKEHEIDRYHVLEAYIKVDVDDSGITSDVVVWLNPTTGEILRATYLYRIMPTGLKPFFKIDFHRRYGTTYGVGLVELLYSLGREIDAIHNLRMDVGILTSLPFGFYRPTSQTPEEQLRIEPGSLIPLDNPGSDVFFPNLGNRTSFGFQEEAALMNQVERLTSVSDLSLGIIGGQGATRTATGTRAILGEANANLDIYLQRMNKGWKQVLRYLFCLLQYKLEPGFEFRIWGSDGKPYWGQIKSREELHGSYDFELEPNTANTNKQVRLEIANLLYQLTANPLDLQLGLITPAERYEAIRLLLLENGIRDISRFVRQPNEIVRKYTPLEVANRILTGMDVQLDPTQDLSGFVNLVQEITSADELMGQFSEFEIAALVTKADEAQSLIQALEQQQAQQMVTRQQQLNTQASQMSGDIPQSVNQPETQGE